MTPPLPRPLKLRTITDSRGSLTAIEPNDGALDFEIRRVFYLHGITPGEARGAHAHRELAQFIVAVHGRLELTLDNGYTRETFILDRPDEGVLVPPMHWGELSGFTEGAVALVLASHPYDESDYIRNYNEFTRLTGCPTSGV
jgi:hypothetical protein